MLYRILKLIVGLGIRSYYREIRILNRENLDQEGPVILIANNLLDGEVVFHGAHGWVRNPMDASIARDDAHADAMEAAGPASSSPRCLAASAMSARRLRSTASLLA